MHRVWLTARRLTLACAATLIAALALATTGAQAVVVDDGGAEYGVALVPNTTLPAGVKTAPSTPSCADPALSPDLTWQTGTNPLCWHGGNVLPSNQVFAITWDAHRGYWSGTRGYVEQFLKDVADGSGTLTSPYALTTQYVGANGRAAYDSKYGGACIDYGNPTNSPNQNTTCLYGSTVQTGPGNAYTSRCTPTGNSYNFGGSSENNVCLTDVDIQNEIQSIASNTQMLTHLGHADRSGQSYKPLIAVLLPPRVEVCLDSTGTLCSANSAAAGQFCAYHSHVMVGSTDVAYVVQPWTALTGCDEPDAPQIPENPPATTLATDTGIRLVSPLSQAEMAAIVNPDLTGWYATDGLEINDNGCTPLADSLDTVTVGNSSQNPYLLQREFNNTSALESDPATYFGCAPNVLLSPNFVVPSAAQTGDVVMFDGSTSASTLMVAHSSYRWDFGDGTPPTYGPSVVHSYKAGGTYNVTLSITDRGNNSATLTQTIQVLGSTGQQVPPAPPVTAPNAGTGSPGSGTGSSGGGTGSSGTGSSGGASGSPTASATLKVHVQLLPQSLKAVLRNGIAVRVSSNKAANGIATVTITRAAAKKAHIKVGKSPLVRIGLGTVSSIKNGTMTLHLHLSGATAKNLSHLKHVAMTVRLALVAPGNQRLAVVAAGRY